MKLPAWITSIVCTIMAAVILGEGSWIFNANAQISSIKVTNELRREQQLKAEETAKSDIKDLKDFIMENKKENKEEHDKIIRTLERLARGK
jgi:hypothetical protein